MATSIVTAGAQTSSAGATGEAVLTRFQGADGERVPGGNHLFTAARGLFPRVVLAVVSLVLGTVVVFGLLFA